MNTYLPGRIYIRGVNFSASLTIRAVVLAVLFAAGLLIYVYAQGGVEGSVYLSPRAGESAISTPAGQAP